jgi:saccharopine dehydrogenase-like NADP-dependent oxidoreductase
MIGATIARDLAADHRLTVTATDVRSDSLSQLAAVPKLQLRQADLSSPEDLRSLIADSDVVVGALPSVFGFRTLEIIIREGKRYCDISFMPEDALGLDEQARRTGAVAVVDCGVAPGLANVLIGHCHARLERVDNVVFYVGGLPKVRYWPYSYRAPFAPLDVIEEYTRPARLIENGRLVVRPALSDAELMDFPQVGTLEAFNTDGLRSLLKTIPAENLREKTLRYPGHIELMRVLRETGFFRKDEIEVGSVRVRPLDVTSRLLFPHWKRAADEDEFTILRVIVEGKAGKESIRWTYDLYDENCRETGMSSMARTTGFPAAIVARMLAFDDFVEPGVHAPEKLGGNGRMVEHLLQELASRGANVTVREERERIDGSSGRGAR